MTELLGSATNVITEMLKWVGQVASTITATGNEILLVGTLIGIVPVGVGIFKALFHNR